MVDLVRATPEYLQETPIVSLAVASYNNAQYLPDLILSVLAQQNPGWELVITDDASTDNSRDVLRQFATDPRIKIQLNQMNKGAAYTFDRSIKSSTGQYVLLLGADDALKPWAVDSILDAHRRFPDAALIAHPWIDCDPELTPEREDATPSNYQSHVPLIKQFAPSFTETFTRAAYNKTDGIDPSFQASLDQDLRLKLDEVGPIRTGQRAFYLYRNHPMGISQGKSRYRALRYACQAILRAQERRTSGKVNAPKLSRHEIKTLKRNGHVYRLLELLAAWDGSNRRDRRELINLVIHENPYWLKAPMSRLLPALTSETEDAISSFPGEDRTSIRAGLTALRRRILFNYGHKKGIGEKSLADWGGGCVGLQERLAYLRGWLQGTVQLLKSGVLRAP